MGGEHNRNKDTTRKAIFGHICRSLFTQSFGYEIASHMRSELPELALKRALWSRKPPKGITIHTDQGSQFISDNYRSLLQAWGINQSMSRRGNCWDNAVIESFFKTFKTETIYQHKTLINKLEMKWLIDESMAHY